MTGAMHSGAWGRLAAMAREARATGLAALFAADPARPETMLITGPHIALDASLAFLTVPMLDLLDELVEESGIGAMRTAMLSGDIVNLTESRPASHATGRGPDSPLVSPMLETALAVREGRLLLGGRRVEAVVNIGIGGSHLGPAMVHRALAEVADGPLVRFVSNVDPVALDDALSGVDPAATLFVVSSKTFTTPETLSNADRARRLLEGIGCDPREYFVAVTAAPERAAGWGVRRERILTFPEGVGGRFSLSGPVGFPVAVAIGPDRFASMLAGMAEMDRHFAGAPAGSNLPIVHAVLAVSEATALGCRSTAVVAYAERLGLLVPYLQQLMMESNGKSTGADGTAVESSAPVVWGGVGTDAQHAVFQWLHQGTDPTPTEFVIVGGAGDLAGDLARRDASLTLIAHALAQGEVLGFGDGGAAGSDPHRRLSGNRPSRRVLLKELSCETLGALIAFYEHSTVVQGWLWGINPFDQFGVEHGKATARSIGSEAAGDPSTVNDARWSVAARWLAAD